MAGFFKGKARPEKVIGQPASEVWFGDEFSG
jgi:hypothetical protein